MSYDRGRNLIESHCVPEYTPDLTTFFSAILSEAKLQRSGRNPRAQTFNLRSFSVHDIQARSQRSFASLKMTEI